MTVALITLPGGLSSDGVQIAVTLDSESGDVEEVLVRPAHSSVAWERLSTVGGSVTVRAS